MKTKFQILLNELDISKEKMDEYAIGSKIREVIGNDKSIESDSELMAFLFREGKDTGSDTYFTPSEVWTAVDGSVFENPSLSVVSSDVIAYWQKRVGETENPVMSARYSGLIWDLTFKIKGVRPDYRIAISYVRSLITICVDDACGHSIDSIQKINRAYTVAKSLNNNELVQSCITTAIELESRIAEDDKPGLWGFSFDLFVLSNEKELSDDVRDKLVRDMESRLYRVRSSAPFSCESVGIALAAYYRSLNLGKEVCRVIEVVGDSFERDGEGQGALVASARYRHAHDLYIRYDLRVKAEAVSKKIAEVGPDVLEGMQEFSQSVEIPPEELEKFLYAMTEGGVEKALGRVTAYFIPKKDRVEKQVLGLSRNFPLQYFFSTTLHDHKGRPVASIGDINTDLEGNVINQVSQNMKMDSFFLRSCLNRIINRYEVTAAQLAEHIFQTPVIEETKYELVQKGIDAYLMEDCVTAIHVLVPQIESSIRNLVELMGSATLRKNRQGGLQLRTLDDLLRDQSIESCFGSDLPFYFRTLLTDQRGWNLRNDVCHGLSPANAFGYVTADRVVHVLLCLAQVKQDDG